MAGKFEEARKPLLRGITRGVSRCIPPAPSPAYAPPPIFIVSWGGGVSPTVQEKEGAISPLVMEESAFLLVALARLL